MTRNSADNAPVAAHRAEAHRKLWQMIGENRFAMMATLEPGGHLRSRPMTTYQSAYDGTLWFFAKGDSAAVKAIDFHPHACLSYGDSKHGDFVCVAGPARIVSDVAHKKKLWNKAVQAWFPEGPESPAIVLIQVVPDHGEYWDSTDSKLVQIFSMAKAVASGTTPRGIGEHRDVPL